MPVRGENSLYFSTALDNSGLQTGALDAVGIIQGLAGQISKINPFAALGVGAVAAFTIIANSAHKMMKEFETEMAAVKTIANVTDAEFAKLEKRVFGLYRELGTESPAGLAKGLYDIIGAGNSAADALKLLEISTKAATAGITTSAVASDGLTTILNAFQLEADKATEVADVMFATVDRGKLSFEDLANNIAQVAPLAAASGFSFQEVAGAIATLTKQGVPASQAMTQIQSAIIATNEVMGDGVSQNMSLQAAFQAMYNEAGGSQNKLKEMAGRIEAVNAILSIAGPNFKGASEDLKAMGDAAGSVERSFDIVTGTSTKQWEIFGNRLKSTTQEIGNVLVTMSGSLAEFLNGAFESSDKLLESYEDQRLELFKLEGAIANANEGSEEFKDLREQIIKLYPEFLGGIDGETASQQQLLGILNQVNEAYIQRYKFATRQKELEEAYQNQANIEMQIEDSSNEFRDILAKIRAENPSIEVDLTLSDEELYKQLNPQIKELTGFMGSQTESQQVLQGMALRLRGILQDRISLTEDLVIAEQKVKEEVNQSREYSLAELKTERGKLEAIKQINSAMEKRDLSQFIGSGIDDIEKAIEARTKILDDFRAIDQTKTLKSLEPFLKDELKEVREYAKERSRILNTEFKPKGGDPDSSFSEMLKAREKEYKDYQAVLEQLGQEETEAQFQNLLQQGRDYGEYLQNLLDETLDFSKKRQIALAASANGIKLNRSVPDLSHSLQLAGIMDVQIDTTTIDYIERQISRLQDARDAANENERPTLNAQLEYWQERLDIARNGIDSEEDIYGNLRRGLEDLNNSQLRDYIKYWKDRLREAKKGSKEEQEALSNIQSAENRIAENTAETLRDVSGALGQASDMFRSFGDDVLADALDKMSGLAMNIGSILTGIASGNWIGVISGVLGGITTLFSGAGGNQMTEYERAIKNLEKSIERLGVSIKTAMGAEAFELRVTRMDEYKKKISEATKQLEEHQAYYDSLADMDMGYFYFGANAQQAIQDQMAVIKEIEAEYKDIKDEFGEFVTGGTADSLTDAIIQGFREGKRGIEDFAGTFEKTMQDTLLKIFKNNLLTAEVQKFYDEIVEAAGGTELNSLSSSEIEALQTRFNEVISNAGAGFSVLQEILEGAGLDGIGMDALNETSRSGLAGAITNITEDTANILEGYMNAIRLDVRQGLEVAIQNSQYLGRIANNTEYNRHLETIAADTRATAQETKSLNGRMANIEGGILEFQAKG